jgi:hypothetical protein
MPPELVEMLAIGFWKRAAGRTDNPPADELARFVGEMQRLAAISSMRKLSNLLETWRGEFGSFVEQQYMEMRDMIRRLTDDAT